MQTASLPRPAQLEIQWNIPRTGDDWERLLAAEGLGVIETLFNVGHYADAPVKFRSLLHPDALEQYATTVNGSAYWADSPMVVVWRDFSSAVHALPPRWSRVPQAADMLSRYSECGALEQARRAVGLSRKVARKVLGAFCVEFGFELRNGVLFRSERRGRQ